MSSVVSISQLAKYYQVSEREGGLKASIASLFNRKYKNVKAVDGITFNIEAGEVVGFLGPNGAGKTTTLKMLSGLLHPTSGSVDVLGYEPRHRSHDYLRQITLVMGNRNQLTWIHSTSNARSTAFEWISSKPHAMNSSNCWS